MASMLKIGTFGDWVGLFEDWRREIGVNPKEVCEFKFETLYGAIETIEIQLATTKASASGRTCAKFPRKICAMP
ncbi:MAG: hypothetical protein DMG67_06815 [Acidobacteria bacterium]|nr:MAG: hypothetical protein DMG67_06815 [Acidobacteriota bacterium]